MGAHLSLVRPEETAETGHALEVDQGQAVVVIDARQHVDPALLDIVGGLLADRSKVVVWGGEAQHTEILRRRVSEGVEVIPCDREARAAEVALLTRNAAG